jgi:hypothetical protein
MLKSFVSPAFLAKPGDHLSQSNVGAHVRVENLDTSQEHENDHNEKDETQAPCRGIAPPPAVRPSRQSPEECQDQNYDQNRSKHVFPLSNSPALPRIKL